MIRFFASIAKELLLLRRDKSGLLVLFAMPALLVFVITLVQNNAMKTVGETQTELLLMDKDGEAIALRMETMLSEATGIQLVKALNDGRILDRDTAIQAVAAGKYPLCLIIPKGLTNSVRLNARKAAHVALSMRTGDPDSTPDASQIEVFFNPTVMGSFRSAIHHALKLMLFTIEVEEKISALSELIPVKLQGELVAALGPAALQGLAKSNLKPDLQWNTAPLIQIRDEFAMRSNPGKMPNAVQQNVPAWALFGVFFIVLPIAGSFIKERVHGVQYRLLSMPVSYLTLVSGKLAAYVMVCVVQFALILVIGKWILPLFGTPAFELGNAFLPGAAIAVSAILAATGYGVMLGTLINSYEQASMFGSLSVVIGAAIGGIMVPVYVMPGFMQKISVISPLSWAQNAFLEVFVRGGTFQSIWGPISGLILFAFACVMTAGIVSSRKTRS